MYDSEIDPMTKRSNRPQRRYATVAIVTLAVTMCAGRRAMAEDAGANATDRNSG